MPFALLVSLLLLTGSAPWPHTASEPPSAMPTISYCDLQSNPSAYLGKAVRLRVLYVYGFEWQEFHSVLCENDRKTWVDMSDSVEACSSRQGRRWLRSSRDTATVGLVVRGRLIGSKGGYGHLGAYDYLFEIDCVEVAELLDKDGRVPGPLLRDPLKRTRAFEQGGTSPTPN